MTRLSELLAALALVILPGLAALPASTTSTRPSEKGLVRLLAQQALAWALEPEGLKSPSSRALRQAEKIVLFSEVRFRLEILVSEAAGLDDHPNRLATH